MQWQFSHFPTPSYCPPTCILGSIVECCAADLLNSFVMVMA